LNARLNVGDVSPVNDLLTVGEVAYLLKCSRQYVHKLIAAGALVVFRRTLTRRALIWEREVELLATARRRATKRRLLERLPRPTSARSQLALPLWPRVKKAKVVVDDRQPKGIGIARETRHVA
jgi:excisionase family DNA binding protein